MVFATSRRERARARLNAPSQEGGSTGAVEALQLTGAAHLSEQEVDMAKVVPCDGTGDG